MPGAVAAVAVKAIAIKLGAKIAVATILGSIASIAVSYVLAASDKKDHADQARVEDEGLQVNTFSSAQPARAIYGERKVGAHIAYMSTMDRTQFFNSAFNTTKNNKFLNMICIWAAHECESIEKFYLDEDLITLDINGNSTNEDYKTDLAPNTSQYEAPFYAIYADNRTYDSDLGQYTYNVQWEIFKRYAGTLYATRSNKQYTTGNNKFPVGFQLFSDGDRVTIYENGGDGPEFRQIVTAIGDVIADENGEATITFTGGLDLEGFGRENATPFSKKRTFGIDTPDNAYNGSAVFVKHNLGSPDQTAFTELVTDSDDWTVNHRLRGLCNSYVRLAFDEDVFDSRPTVLATVKGKKVYDPRTSTTAWSNNPALCVRDFLISYYPEITADDIDDDTVIAAANICDELISKRDGSQIKRYTCDAVLQLDRGNHDNVRKLITSMQGALVDGEKIEIYAGAYTTPVHTIDDSYKGGPFEMMPYPPRQDLYNAVKGTFIDADNNWEVTDFPPLTNAAFETEDGGHQLWRDVQVNTTTDVERAQRLAKIIHNRSRFMGRLAMQCNFKAIDIKAYENVYYTNSDLGYTNKVFKVIEWTLDPNGGGISMQLQEEDASIYDWEATDAELLNQGTSLTPANSRAVGAPSNLEVSESLYLTRNAAGLKTEVTVNFEEADDAFVREYELEYSGISDHEDLPVFVKFGRSVSTEFVVPDFPTGDFTFRVRSINQLGHKSDWVEASYTVLGKAAVPEDVTGFSADINGNSAFLSWDAVSDLDVQYGGNYIIKFTENQNNPTWAEGQNILPLLPGNSTQAVSPLRTGTYMIKAKDATGQESANPALLIIDDPAFQSTNQIITHDEYAEGFLGTKTNMDVHPDYGYLRLTDNELIGEYIFDNDADGGAVRESQVSVNFKYTNFEETTLLSDDTLTWDDTDRTLAGGLDNAISTNFLIRTTNDDPTATPTWSDWKPFIAGQFRARAYQMKLQASSSSSDHNLAVTELKLNVDVPDVMENGVVTTSLLGVTSVEFTKIFFVPPQVVVTIINAEDSERVIITNITTTGFDIEIKNTSDNRISKPASWVCRGY